MRGRRSFPLRARALLAALGLTIGLLGLRRGHVGGERIVRGGLEAAPGGQVL